MSFIGIICDNKNEKHVKQILNKKLQNKTIIFLNEESIENLKNIKFETIIIMSNNKNIFAKKELLKNIISKAKVLVINADEKINLDLLKNISLNVITYGFNSKSTITASSVKEEDIMICVQRSFKNLNEEDFELQEICIKKQTPKIEASVIMGIVTILLLYGIQSL